MGKHKYDVVILTESRYTNPSSPGEYVQNILKEDGIVLDTLQKRGLTVTRIDWADPVFDWNTTRAALFRTTWDYFDRLPEFSKWLEITSPQTRLINSPELVNWNIDKHYLDYLGGKGVRVVPTRYLDRGSSLSIHKLHHITGWEDTVIKPTVGGASRYTYRIQPGNINIISNKISPAMKEEDFMLQPFQYSIFETGEWSYVFFGGNFTHAVQKKARSGDFRVQDDFGGTVHHYKPTQQEIDFALSVVAACPEMPAYARVDIVIDNDGKLALSELELIEPELWFRLNPAAADLLVDEIIKRLP